MGDANLAGRKNLSKFSQTINSKCWRISLKEQNNYLFYVYVDFIMFMQLIQMDSLWLSWLFSFSFFLQLPQGHLPFWSRQICPLHPATHKGQNLNILSKNLNVHLTCMIALIIISASSFASAWNMKNIFENCYFMMNVMWSRIGDSTRCHRS